MNVSLEVWTNIHHCKFNQCYAGSRCRGVRGHEIRCIAPTNFLTKILHYPKISMTPRSNGHTMWPVLFLAYRRIFDARAA